MAWRRPPVEADRCDVESYAMRSALERLINNCPIAAKAGDCDLLHRRQYHDVNRDARWRSNLRAEQPRRPTVDGPISRAPMFSGESRMKKRSGDLPSNYESEVAPFIEPATEITRALQFFFTLDAGTRA